MTKASMSKLRIFGTIIFLSTVSFSKSSVDSFYQAVKGKDICRDKDGLDCTNHPPEFFVEAPILFGNGTNIMERLKDACCFMGGGDRINIAADIFRPIVEVLVRENALTVEDVQENRPSIRNALMWILKEDTYFAHPTYIVQRYALAVVFYELGGEAYWKTCWAGRRYTDHDDFIVSEHGEYYNFYTSSIPYLKNSTECATHRNGKAWLTPSNECEWAFLECDRHKFVTTFEMPANVNVSSRALPYHRSAPASATISTHISLLKKVQVLNLSGNGLTGTIPSSINRLLYLRDLNLYNNQIGGSLPQELFEISGLEYLTLGRNIFSGTIPPAINQLHNLKSIHIGYNVNITGTIPKEIPLNLALLEVANIVGTGISAAPQEICSSKAVVDWRLNCEVKRSEGCHESCYEASSAISLSNDFHQVPWHTFKFLKNQTFNTIDGLGLSIGCDWFELNDERSCQQYGYKFQDSFGRYAASFCAGCGKCTDFHDWGDDDITCLSMYADEPGCPVFGSIERDDGIKASEACCYCGGGLRNITKSSTLVVQKAGSCEDYIGWNTTCRDITNKDRIGCPSYGHSVYEKDGFFASEACCYCGGGIRTESLGSFPAISSPTCKDIQIARPWPKFNCKFFDKYPDMCEMYGDTNLTDALISRPFQAKDVCCSCGGGFRDETCQDFSGWIDSYDEMPYTCNDYEKAEECWSYGKGYHNRGHNALSSCCGCGGGKDKLGNELDVVVPKRNASCQDYHKYSSQILVGGKHLTCEDYSALDSYDEKIELCLLAGHSSSLSYGGYNATYACCDSIYGVANSGGGYRGDLIGADFRIGYIYEDEIRKIYSHRPQNKGNVSGDLYDAVKGFFLQVGAEVLSYDMDHLNEKYGSQPSSYDTCIDYLDAGVLDMCVGIYWEVTLPSSFPRTIPFYSTKIYMVQREHKLPMWERYLKMFSSFTIRAWILIFIVLSIFTCASSSMNENRSGDSNKSKNYFTRKEKILHASYSAFMLCIGKRSVSSKAKAAEQIALFGFGLFCLYIVSEFTSAITATLVHESSPTKYESIEDVFRLNGKICIFDAIKIPFLTKYPNAEETTKTFSTINTTVLLNSLDDKTCDVVLTAKHAYQHAASMNNHFCKFIMITYGEPILSLNVVIPISPTLNSLGNELLNEFDKYIEIIMEYVYYNGAPNDPTCEFFEYKESDTVSVDYSPLILPACISIVSSMIGLYIYYFRESSPPTLSDNDSSSESDGFLSSVGYFVGR